MISTKQVQYALAVEKTRHFKKAAELCRVSQSTLSSAIAEMENQLGVQVFERDNKQVLVTPIGQRILDKARVVRNELREIELLAKTSDKPLSYPLRLGVIPTVGPYLLPQILPDVRRRYPDSRIEISEAQSDQLLQRVRNGELDTAILAIPYNTEGLHSFEFWEENFYFAFHKDSEFAGRKSISPADLDDTRLLLLEDGHCLKDHALAACKLDRNSGNYAMSGTSLFTLTQMVANDMGTTLLPELALKLLLGASPELRAIPLQEPGPHRKLALVTRLNYAGVNDIELLRKMFRESLTAQKSARTGKQ
jgi:LysR family hydrogen peroxide-inducible transcriptional activator